jgi:predicted alpha/beta-fold hydrolase
LGGTVYPLVLLALLVLAPPALAQDITMIPVTVDGETIQLAMRIYKPTSAGPAPTLVFNHGSTGRGTDPSIFVRPIDFPPLAQFFVERGWAVVMPARRGRGGSEGRYEEGFAHAAGCRRVFKSARGVSSLHRSVHLRTVHPLGGFDATPNVVYAGHDGCRLAHSRGHDHGHFPVPLARRAHGDLNVLAQLG